MAQVSLRIQKLKCGNIAGATKHNQRKYSPDNADPERSVLNETPIGTGDLDQLVFSRIKDLGAQYIESGKNASVIAVEMVLSASPEFFRDDPADVGNFDQRKMEQWRDANLKFLTEKYGDNLVRVDVHLDEATPHMHAIITPLVDKQRKIRGQDAYKNVTVLDAKHMFNRSELIKLQTEGAEAVAHLGIERGIRGSKAKHTDVKQFYTKIHESTLDKSLEPVFDHDVKLIGGMSKTELKEYANAAIEAHKNEVRELHQRIKNLETQLETKTKQLKIFSKYQSVNGDEQAFLKNIRDTVKQDFDRVVGLFEKKLTTLADGYNSLLEEKSRLEHQLDQYLGFPHGQDPALGMFLEEEKPINPNVELEKAKKNIGPEVDWDDSPSI